MKGGAPIGASPFVALHRQVCQCGAVGVVVIAVDGRYSFPRECSFPPKRAGDTEPTGAWSGGSTA